MIHETFVEPEIKRLQRWKAEAMLVLGEWEDVWEAAGRPGILGQSKAKAMKELFTQRKDDD